MKQHKLRPTKGTLQQRRDSWFWLYYAPGSKKVSVRLGSVEDFRNKQAVVDAANERLKNGEGPQRDIAADAHRSATTLITTIAEAYLADCKHDLRPATVNGYRKIYEQHLEAHFGQRRLCDYRTHIASDYLKGLARSGKYSQNTISHVRAVMSAIFAYAIDEGYGIAENPVASVKKGIKATKIAEETQHYTESEMRIIFAALDDEATLREYAVMALALEMGLRKAEVCALKWPDVELAKGVLHVRRSAWQGKVNDAPKNKKSVRSIPLLPHALDALSRYKASEKVLGAYVFENGAGNPLDLGLFAARRIRPALKAKGVTLWRGFHSGRRGSETAMAQLANGNIQALSNFFGSSPETMMKHYLKAVPEATAQIAAMWGKQLKSASSSK